MKQFSELTNEEILDLTHDELERYKDYECAVAGVPLPPRAPGPKPEPVERHPDLTLYEVAGVYFVDREEAEFVAGEINAAKRVKDVYIVGKPYSVQVVEPVDVGADSAGEVKTKQAYTREGWQADAARITAHEKEKAAYEQEAKERREAMAKRAEVSEWIDEYVESVRSAHRRRTYLLGELDRYVSLADGDRATALRFLREAHADAPECLPEEYPNEESTEEES